jgi:hypothetical protein
VLLLQAITNKPMAKGAIFLIAAKVVTVLTKM